MGGVRVNHNPRFKFLLRATPSDTSAFMQILSRLCRLFCFSEIREYVGYARRFSCVCVSMGRFSDVVGGFISFTPYLKCPAYLGKRIYAKQEERFAEIREKLAL